MGLFSRFLSSCGPFLAEQVDNSIYLEVGSKFGFGSLIWIYLFSKFVIFGFDPTLVYELEILAKNILFEG